MYDRPARTKSAHGGHFGVVQRGVVGDEHIVRAIVVNGDAHLLQLGPKHVVAQKKSLLAGHFPQAPTARRLTGGQHVAIALRHAHAGQLLPVYVGGLAGIVGQKEIGSAGFPQHFQKIQRAVQKIGAQIEGSVHVQHKALDAGQLFANRAFVHESSSVKKNRL